MNKDRDKWNAKYQQAKDENPLAVSVERFWPLAPSNGRALDLAAGLGGNSLFLAAQGFRVDAVDVSDVAMARLQGRHPKVTPICADLDHFTIPAGTYDLIINIHFLNRRMFPLIMEGLKPGGVLIFETFLEGVPQQPASNQDSHSPACRDYLLRPNELLCAFLKLHILFYEEKENHPPIRASHLATLVARRVDLC